MKILFICRFNRFRSKTAEAIFNKLNKNSNNSAKSAGIIRGSPISKDIIDAANEIGVEIKGSPQGLTTELLQWYDHAVIVADDLPKSILYDNPKYGHTIETWKIPDTAANGKEDMQKTVLEIEKRVKSLLRRLK